MGERLECTCHDSTEADDDLPEIECYHEDYELDILIGRATCCHCEHRWYLSADELRRDHELRAAAYPKD